MIRKAPLWKRLMDASTTVKRFNQRPVHRDTMTVARARMVLNAVGQNLPDGVSKINSGLSKEQSFKILDRAVPADDESLPGAKINPWVAKNIAREFGSQFAKIHPEVIS